MGSKFGVRYFHSGSQVLYMHTFSSLLVCRISLKMASGIIDILVGSVFCALPAPPGEVQGRVPGLSAAPAPLAGRQLGLGPPGPVLVLAVQQLLVHLPGDLPVDLDPAVGLGRADPQELVHLPVEGLGKCAGRHKFIVLCHDR